MENAYNLFFIWTFRIKFKRLVYLRGDFKRSSRLPVCRFGFNVNLKYFRKIPIGKLTYLTKLLGKIPRVNIFGSEYLFWRIKHYIPHWKQWISLDNWSQTSVTYFFWLVYLLDDFWHIIKYEVHGIYICLLVDSHVQITINFLRSWDY